MMRDRPDPEQMAADFLRLNANEFRQFWAAVQFEWNIEGSEVEAEWFYFGKTMRGPYPVIGAIAAAVAAGKRSTR